MLLSLFLANIVSVNNGIGRYESVGSRVVQIASTTKHQWVQDLHIGIMRQIINKSPFTGIGLVIKIESIP
jgi:hypothetical protein